MNEHSGRGGSRGLKLENRYCPQVSSSLICGEHNAKQIGAPPPWKKLPQIRPKNYSRRGENLKNRDFQADVVYTKTNHF